MTKFIKEQPIVETDEGPDVVIVTGRAEAEAEEAKAEEGEDQPLVTEEDAIEGSVDALAETREQLTKTKTQYE